MAESTSQVALHNPVSISMAKERMLWATRPLGFLLLVLWVLHPYTADRPDHAQIALLGFLLGAGYGLIVYGSLLRGYISVGGGNARTQANRVPEEYYWGVVDRVMSAK